MRSRGSGGAKKKVSTMISTDNMILAAATRLVLAMVPDRHIGSGSRSKLNSSLTSRPGRQ